uniref:Signal peptide peptidase SppA n=1 Tax=Desulfomonile tiedjei TaxID=2358 RepID=A0A7C4ARA6_9BACT
MKPSRTKKSILAIVIIILVFLGISLLFTLSTNEETPASRFSDFLESNKIGVVTVEGELTSADETLKELRKFQRRGSVKAVVLRINSPGGAVAPAQEIYREVIKTRKKKPVVASMQTMGTSAAYYIASSADKIVCSAGTITGSIGVIMMLADLEKIMDRVGLNVKIIKAGKYKDIGSMFRPLTDDERNILQDFAAEIHEQFIHDVAKARKGKIEEKQLRSIADGRFFTGEKAKEMGLVDTIGNFYDAVKIASELGGVKGEPELIYPKKKWENYLDLLMESSANAFGKVFNAARTARPQVELR